MQMTAQAVEDMREQLLIKLNQEHQGLKAVVEHLPEDKMNYTPHEKVKPFGELAHHIGATGAWFGSIMETGEVSFDVKPPQAPATKAELATQLDQMHEGLVNQVKRLSADQLSKTIQFASFGAFPAVTFLDWHASHLIHHRGQLTTYLRAMGAKVPAIYGGSADFPMNM